jgi:hypothetical protein
MLSMFEKIANAICWVAAGIIIAFLIVVVLIRGGLHVGIGLAWLFAYSDLPWWVLLPAAIALLAGFAYLFLKSMGRRVPPNRKFL